MNLPQETGVDEILDAYEELVNQADLRDAVGRDGSGEYRAEAKQNAKQALLQLFEKEAVDGSTYHSPGLSNNTKVITLSKLIELLGGANV